jgi:hypothetical protein
MQMTEYNNSNQVFYSQVSWGKLEMKSYESKNRDKTREKQRAIKNQIKKRRKDNKTLSQKSEKGWNFF